MENEHKYIKDGKELTSKLERLETINTTIGVIKMDRDACFAVTLGTLLVGFCLPQEIVPNGIIIATGGFASFLGGLTVSKTLDVHWLKKEGKKLQSEIGEENLSQQFTKKK